MTKKINGIYKTDNNFITVYADNRMYTIARSTGDWASVAVGQRMANGFVFTQEIYDQWSSECTQMGTFEIEGDEDELL